MQVSSADYRVALSAHAFRKAVRGSLAMICKHYPLFWSAKVAAVVLVLTGYNPALADWWIAGAQYSCSTKTGRFVLLPHDQSSDNENPSLESGFKALGEGVSTLACRIGKRMLKAQVGVMPPQNHGMCMGRGSVQVGSLVVDGVELLEHGIEFNWNCLSSDAPIVKISVRTSGNKIELEQCTGKAVESNGDDKKPGCSRTSFDVDAIAVANAKADHQLADLQTQASKSAIRLPSGDDLAKVFPTKFPANSSIPLCAHWHSTFINAIIAPERQRHGRIAGSIGERVYLRPTNPQLCSNRTDDGCTPTAYVIPGDRVNVGFICGDWATVQYPNRILSKPAIQGWVETSRLYDVDSMVARKASPIPDSNSESNSLAPDDPLQQAVKEKNVEKLNRLVSEGGDPNGKTKSGEPLRAAIQSGDLDLVQALVKLGANINIPGERFWGCPIVKLALGNERIFDALVKAGIDLNCRGGQFGQSALMDLAYYNRLWAWERLHNTNVPRDEQWNDPVLLARRLLDAGADPNLGDEAFGRTALYYALEANNVDVVQLLLNSGANPNVTIDSTENGASVAQQTGSTPLMAAFHWYSLTRDPAVFNLLLAHGADPDYRNPSRYNAEWDATTSGAVTFAGQTVLTRAAEDGHYTLVRVLLEHGANPAIHREDGALPADLARKHKHPEIAELIASYSKRLEKGK